MLPRVLLCVCCGFSFLVGCGDTGPGCVPVTGTATLDGKPLANKSLLFIPEPGTSGNGAAAHTDQQGKYCPTAIVFGATRDYPGVPPGRYRVIVNEPVTAVAGGEAGGNEADGTAPAMVLESTPRRSEIPAIYTSEKTSPLILDVPESGGVLDIALVRSSQ